MITTLHRLVFAILMSTMGASCVTAYDSYGRPQTYVEPGAAMAGAAAIGLLGYGLGSSNRRHHDHYYRPYYRPYYGHHSYGHHSYGHGHHHY